jgi:hypothetical protein
MASKMPRAGPASNCMFWLMEKVTQTTSMIGSNHSERCPSTSFDALLLWKHGRVEQGIVCGTQNKRGYITILQKLYTGYLPVVINKVYKAIHWSDKAMFLFVAGCGRHCSMIIKLGSINVAIAMLH